MDSSAAAGSSEKLTPKELALLELQREELKGKFELEKQRAANRGAWVGAAITVAGAIGVAVFSYFINESSTTSASASSAKIAEWKKYSESLEAQLAKAENRPPILAATIYSSETTPQLCEAKAASVALKAKIVRVSSEYGFIGHFKDTSVLISCEGKMIAVAGSNHDRVLNILRQLQDDME